MSQGIVEFNLAEEEDDDFEEGYELEESILPLRNQTRRPFYATARGPYYRPGQAQHGTMTAPGGAPVPVRYNNVARADQVQNALKKVESDIVKLASAIKLLESRQGGGMKDMLPLLLLGQQSAPEIEKITFSDDNDAPFDTADEVSISKTTYKQQKSNLGLILAMTAMGGDSKDSNMGLLLAVALGGL